MHHRNYLVFLLALAILPLQWVSINPVDAYGQTLANQLDTNKRLSQFVIEHWNSDNGLPQNSVTAILQSSHGYLWLGTEEGLVRFDGTQFTTFDKINTEAFLGDAITALAETPDHILWIGTRGGGILKYEQGAFTSYSTEDGLLSKDITTLYVDSGGSLWAGTYGGGIFQVSADTFVNYGEQQGLSGKFVSQIVQDPENRLWIGTEEGLFYLKNNQFFRIDHVPINESFITALFVDAHKTLWIGTENQGLFTLTGSELLKQTTPFSDDHYINTIIADNLGSLWFGLNREGIARLHNETFEVYSAGTDNTLYEQGEVLALFQDREGSLWVGQQSNGLYRFRNERFTPFGAPEGLNDDKALSITEHPEGHMWVGTQNGLNLIIDNRIKEFEHAQAFDGLSVLALDAYQDSLWVGTLEKGLFLLTDNNLTHFTEKNGLPSRSVFGLFRDSRNRLWIATDMGAAIYSNGSLTLLDEKTGLSSNLITSFAEDKDGAIWIGTYDAGLIRYHEGSYSYLTEEDGLSNNIILSFYVDEEHTIWIGTYGGGLNRYAHGRITSYSTREGLFNDNIYTILEDSNGFLWMSCNKGIFKVNKTEFEQVTTGRIERLNPIVYGKKEGLRNQEANGGFQPAGWQSGNGRLWFPTLRGVVSIDPSQDFTNYIIPHIEIEKLLVDDVEIPLNQGRIVLDASIKKVQFEFTALSLIVPDHVRFRYSLEGVNNEWSGITNRREATYTNLKPGTYAFKVIAQNNSGIWSEKEASLTFFHKPYYFQTIWFKLLIGLLLVSSGAALYRIRTYQLRIRQQELERLIEEQTRDLREEKEKTEEAKEIIESQAEKLLELDRFKTKFFANISHEFRTPLTMIIGPLENSLSGYYGTVSDPMIRQFRIMLRNAQRLLRLINQLLDLSKLEVGKMELHTQFRNIVPFLENILMSCTPMAEGKMISLQFKPTVEEIRVYYEPDKLEKVFFNLLSNALKFTPRDGTISMVIAQRTPSEHFPEGAVEIRLNDTGRGIPKGELPHIFNRFHQVPGSNTRDQEGTGIGLALVRELILLHKGDIQVESILNEGTEFTILLPLGKSHLTEDQILPEGMLQNTSTHVISELATISATFDHESEESIPLTDQTQSDGLTNKRILIVDDNKDILEYVAGILSREYIVELASDGLDALEKTRLLQPDLIISDLMMPRMDGNELCKQIKSDPELNHIPVVLMTARATNDLRIEGLEMGADDYIAKPFNARELIARTSNLLLLRENQKRLKTLNKDLESKVNEQLEVIIKEREKYEFELLSAKEKAEESSRLKSIILDNVNHEFRTPIAGIIGSADILAMEVTDEMQEFVGYIKKNTLRLQNTLDAVLELSSLENRQLDLQFGKIDLNTAVKDTADRYGPLATEKGLDFETSLQDSPCIIYADEFALSRILDHLVDNAIKFTSQGWIRLELTVQNNIAIIRIIDSGIGISEAFMPRLFEAFVQESNGTSRAFEGIGIGLSISRKLIDLMGGEIIVQSEKNKGTTVELHFPLIREFARPHESEVS